MQLSALVAAAGYGHVAAKAVTQLRREIASHPQTWSIKGDRVFLMKSDAVDESPDGMLAFLQKRSTEAVLAFTAIGLTARRPPTCAASSPTAGPRPSTATSLRPGSHRRAPAARPTGG